MIGVAIVVAALLAVMVLSELALRGTKLQTGLSRVLVVWAGVYLPAIGLLVFHERWGLASFTIFWAGAFLSWFGVRSHIESSILLRMLYLLREHTKTEGDLVALYLSRYGEATRREELVRGGLAVRTGAKLVVTPKGKTILSVVAKLK